MKNRLFLKFGIIHLLLFLAMLLAIDLHVVGTLQQEYVATAYAQLESLAHLAQSRLPDTSATASLREWAGWLARAGTRVTLVAADGKVLADSDEDPARMDNHIGRPEISEALAIGSGRAVRHSPTIGHDLVYLATRQQLQDGTLLIIRFSIPLERLDSALSGFRRGLWTISLVILLLAGGISLLSFRAISIRLQRLQHFSRRVAGGDFRPLSLDRRQDELTDLALTLNQTASRLDASIRTLTEERNQSAAVLAGMAEGVAVISADQRVLYCNTEFLRALNIENAAWKNRPVVEAVPNADLLAYIGKARAGNRAISSELAVGSVRVRHFDVTVTPVKSEGAAAGSVVVLHDITELRRLERARRDFVANVSHELKTPLTAIQGFSETLLDGALEDPDNSRRFLEIIRENAIRLGRMTDDLLRLAQVEAGQLPMQFQPVEVQSVIRPCLETVRLDATAKRLTLDVDCLPSLPRVSGDPGSLQQVVQNLLDNAVRYSPEGGRISIKAAFEGENIVISVSDTGPGIPKTEQERIFERFYRTDSARSRDLGGTGLGLSIARHLAEAHGGKILVRSDVGSGATFTVILARRERGSCGHTTLTAMLLRK